VLLSVGEDGVHQGDSDFTTTNALRDLLALSMEGGSIALGIG
jgi:hypothetical protein